MKRLHVPEDPRVNFAISERDGRAGVQHLGIQVEDRGELAEVYEQMFLTSGESTVYGSDEIRPKNANTAQGSCGEPRCCAPQPA